MSIALQHRKASSPFPTALSCPLISASASSMLITRAINLQRFITLSYNHTHTKKKRLEGKKMDKSTQFNTDLLLK